jgi:SAM-dependent methyltransferase
MVLARERGLMHLHFLRADGMALPFAAGQFDLVLSHAVIEHVSDARLYLQECRRVLKPGGRMFLSTAPYLSFAGAHLPRLRIPIPLHLIVGRTIAFRTFRLLARHAPGLLKEPAHENSFIRDARNGVVKEGRSARKGDGESAARPDCRRRSRDRPGRTARHVNGAAHAERDREMAGRERAHAERVD